MAATSNLAIFYNMGAIAGALAIGHLAQKIGRQRAVMVAPALALIAIPAWAPGAFAIASIAVLVLLFGVGPERQGRDLECGE